MIAPEFFAVSLNCGSGGEERVVAGVGVFDRRRATEAAAGGAVKRDDEVLLDQNDSADAHRRGGPDDGVGDLGVGSAADGVDSELDVIGDAGHAVRVVDRAKNS